MRQSISLLIPVFLLSLFGVARAQDQMDKPFGEPLPRSATASRGSASPHAYLVPDDVSFAHIAVGGVWRTSFYTINMSNNPIPYSLYFYDGAGNPLTLPVAQSDGSILRLSVWSNTIQPNGEQNFTATNTDPDLKVGQAVLVYDHSLGQIGGFSVFQEAIPGQPVYEATVPLSGSDYKFYLAYYHFDGYVSGVALANPGTTSTVVSITALDNLGHIILQDSIPMGPLSHTSFVLTDRYPQLNNTRGNLYVTSSNGRLSAVGLRFSPAGAYTTIPIMNWTGMFP